MKRKRVSKAIVQQPGAQFYDGFVEAIKKRIRTAQIKAALAANAELVLHYWEIGRDILASQKREGCIDLDPPGWIGSPRRADDSGHANAFGTTRSTLRHGKSDIIRR